MSTPSIVPITNPEEAVSALRLFAIGRNQPAEDRITDITEDSIFLAQDALMGFEQKWLLGKKSPLEIFRLPEVLLALPDEVLEKIDLCGLANSARFIILCGYANAVGEDRFKISDQAQEKALAFIENIVKQPTEVIDHLATEIGINLETLVWAAKRVGGCDTCFEIMQHKHGDFACQGISQIFNIFFRSGRGRERDAIVEKLISALYHEDLSVGLRAAQGLNEIGRNNIDISSKSAVHVLDFAYRFTQKNPSGFDSLQKLFRKLVANGIHSAGKNSQAALQLKAWNAGEFPDECAADSRKILKDWARDLLEVIDNRSGILLFKRL